MTRSRQVFAMIFYTLVWSAMPQSAAAAKEYVDLELVLAVDVSMSMDVEEQKLQRDGYVAAFRDPELLKAIQGGLHGRIAVTYIEWAGSQTQAFVKMDSETLAKHLARDTLRITSEYQLFCCLDKWF